MITPTPMKQYIQITVTETPSGYSVSISDATPYHATRSLQGFTPPLPRLARGENLNATTAAETVATAVRQWEAHKAEATNDRSADKEGPCQD